MNYLKIKLQYVVMNIILLLRFIILYIQESITNNLLENHSKLVWIVIYYVELKYQGSMK